MAAYFLDSSALVKRFARETGSAWVISLIRPTQGHSLYVARITAVEVMSALARRLRNKSLTPDAAQKAMFRLERSLRYRYAFVDFNAALAMRAMDLARQHALRGYDAVQLASALWVNDSRLALGIAPLTLVSADNALNAAAALEGLTVANPNLHP